MLFSYNWLQSFFKKRLPRPERLADLLATHSFEVSEVKKVGNDFVLDIDVLPNRGPDCFSHLGIAREISAITGLKWPDLPLAKEKSRKVEKKDFISIEVKEKKACLRYTACLISNARIESSPKWLRERLAVCGLRPINNIVDIANYVMLETGQPLHAFDGEKIEGKKIIVRFGKKNEKIITLDDEKYDLDEKILVIADSQKPIAIAGIKGGKETGINAKTKIVLLESANFHPQIIRRGSKLIDLKTDASWRFEHGLDPNLTKLATKRALYLIQKIAGGKPLQGIIDFYPQKIFPQKIELDLNYVEKLLGVKISQKEIRDILKKLGFKILTKERLVLSKERKSEVLEVEVPTFRRDIFSKEDLVEEIARIYGYEKIPALFPISSLIPPKRNLDIFWEDVCKDILKEVGFSEAYNYSFFSQREAEVFQYNQKELIEIENPTSLEFQYLRPSLIPNLLKNVAKNFRNFREIKIFELGKIFRADSKFPLTITEKKALTGVISGEAFYLAKGVIDLLLSKLGISNVWYDEYQSTPEDSKISLWHPKRCAEIKVDQQEIGFLGEISSKILQDMEIEDRVVVFDLDFEKLAKLASEKHQFRPISPYPAAIRDIAVLVPRNVKVEEVLNLIEITGGKLIRDVELFDIYEGEELPEGKKNLAFRIIYQAEDRTLTSEEIEKIQEKIIKALEKEPSWQVRK